VNHRQLLFSCHLIVTMATGELSAALRSVSGLYLGLFVIAAYLLTARLRQYYRLSHFKGPATTGISWWWHSKAVLSGQSHRYYGDATEKYGISKDQRQNMSTHADWLLRSNCEGSA
jgi:hypothetical protein